MLKYSVSRDPEVGFEGFTFLHLQQFLLQIFLEELMPPSNSSDFWNNLLSSAMMHLSPRCSLTSFYHAQVLSSTSWTISLAWSISAQYSTLGYFHWSVLDGQSCSISHSLMLEKKKLLQTWTWLFKAGFASHAFLKYALEVGFKKNIQQTEVQKCTKVLTWLQLQWYHHWSIVRDSIFAWQSRTT